MRKGLILTERDYKILKHLVVGPATVNNIFEHFFKSDNGKTPTRWRVMMRRLKKYEEEKLVHSKHNPRIGSVIYVLTKKGAECAADKYGFEVSNVWTHIPKHDNIFHDLMVSGLAKVILKETQELKGYRIDYLYSEAYIKKEEGPRKGVYIPDLRTRILTPKGFFDFDIEIDCGTISRKDFTGKITSFDNVILIITKTAERLELLLRYMQETFTVKDVFIATYNDVFYNGFFTHKWHANSVTRRSLVDITS